MCNILKSHRSFGSMFYVYVTGPVSIPVWVKKGTMSFPKSPETPVIMVGPGTGVAPFRGVLEERVQTGAGGMY